MVLIVWQNRNGTSGGKALHLIERRALAASTHKLSRRKARYGLELAREVRGTRVASNVGNLFERAATIGQQFLHALHLLGDMVLLDSAPLELRKHTAYGIERHTHLLLNTGRQLKAALGLVAHMMHHGPLSPLQERLLGAVDAAESKICKGGIEAPQLRHTQGRHRIRITYADFAVRNVKLAESIFECLHAVAAHHIADFYSHALYL